MEKSVLEKRMDLLLQDLKEYIQTQPLSENEVYLLKAEIDKLLYECLYYKPKYIC